MRRCTYLILAVIWASSASGQEISEKEKGLYATGQIELKAAIGTQNRVVIKSAAALSGSLTIQTYGGRDVIVAYSKQARTDDKQKATDYIDLMSVSTDRMAEEVRIEMRAPNPAPWKGDEAGIVEAVITVPQEIRLEIQAQQFDVKVEGPLRGLVIPQSLGKLDIRGIDGLLDVNTVNRKVTLEDISGEISVGTTNSSIEARTINAVSSQARFRNDGGDILIEKFAGTINARNSYGRIDISEFEPVGSANYIRNSSGPIILEIERMLDARLVVTNQYEDIEITMPDTVSAYISLKVDEDGTIDASQFPFKAELVEHDRLNLRAGAGAAEISGTVRGKGNISIKGYRGD